MFRWTPYTFVRISAFFIGGILLGVYNPGSIPLFSCAILLLLLGAMYIVVFVIKPDFPKAYFGTIALPAVFLAGYVHVFFQAHPNQQNHLTYHHDSIEFYRAVITRYSDEKIKTWKTEALLTEVYSGGQWSRVKAKVLFYFSREDFGEPYQYGDILLIKGAPSVVPKPSNPGEFDYKRYLSFRNIFHQHFLRKKDIQLIGHKPLSKFIEYAYRCRQWCDKTLEKFVTGQREQAVASALVLGVTDGLDNELLNAYSATGAMHVLAVSGLHISIIYMIIMWVLKPLLKLRAGPWLLAIISLVLLWLYAFVTGLSPSVLRAVTMFSFMALARPTGQTTNIYNTLGASVFCLLLFDPFLIMSVGFQLSYLAVLGIVYLQPALYNLWNPTTYLLDEIWKITCVSIAAQVATFSLGLLYFHQFPNYFLLSNLLVIPGSFVVLILGILVLALGVINVLGVALGFLLTWSIKFINYVVFVVEGFPFSLIENIYISTFQSWIIMLAITMIVFMFQFKSLRFLYFAFAFVFALTMLQWQHHHDAFMKRKLTVYNVQGHTAFDFMENGHALFFTDSVLFADRDRTRFHIHPNRLFAGIQDVQFAGSGLQSFRNVQGGRIICWNNLVVMNWQQPQIQIPPNLVCTLWIVSNNSLRVSDLLKQKSSPPLIILDSSNSYFYSSRFSKEARRAGFQVYSVRDNGAFEHYLAEEDTER